MALPKDFLPRDSLPEVLYSRLEQLMCRLNEALAQADNLAAMQHHQEPGAAWAALSESRRQQLARVLCVSDFAGDTLSRYPGWLQALESSGELDAAPEAATQSAWLQALLEEAGDEPTMLQALRRFRRARMLGIVWRDLVRPAGRDMWATAASVTTLAEVCLEGALRWLEQQQAQHWGHPALRADGHPQRLVVLGMGKLGAGELNLSSDIDLIFAYPERGNTEGGGKTFDHQEYFTRLGQKLIAALDAITVDGFVFRVDMRLRPLGDGGPLVGSFSSLGHYYQDQGREWERYAMLKARPVAGDLQAGYELLMSLRPFVYRRYLDFGAIESLREMKAMINRQVRRKGMDDNIKLGWGGIREAEFVVQAFQLIRGGRDTELQVTSLRQALRALPALKLLPQAVVDELEPDYVFLRDLEHAIQALEDRQTQALPEDKIQRARVALALRIADWSRLVARLRAVRKRIHAHFDEVIADPEEEVEEAVEGEEQGSLEEWRNVWSHDLDNADTADDDIVTLLREHGFVDPVAGVRRLTVLREGRAVNSMQRIGLERLDALMPMLLAAVADSESPDVALERVLLLVEAVLRRTAYLALLRENPQALGHLVRLCAASHWVAEQLARHPILLDELLTPETLYIPADRQRLADELRQALGRVPEDDDEAQLEALRVFKHAQVLHVAASDLTGARALMKVSDYLTFIAEVVLEQVLAMAWKHLVRKYGRPRRDAGMAGESGFVIIGYGKLGGIELGYGSDLDLVFIHDAATHGSTDGPRQIDNAVFFTRLGQRIIHLLTAVTAAGALYEVDMRLRPSGNAGLLVTSLDAFTDYQHHQAWTWEHQALVRARAVAGDAGLAKRFTAVRSDVLGMPRDRHMLRDEVVKMRAKMREHLGSNINVQQAGHFDLKQDTGGMVDIEFLCQYAVLALGAEVPELLHWSDNIRLLETLEVSGRLPAGEAQGLRDAYLAYRHATHRADLTKGEQYLDKSAMSAHRQRVQEVWQYWMEDRKAEPDGQQ